MLEPCELAMVNYNHTLCHHYTFYAGGSNHFENILTTTN